MWNEPGANGGLPMLWEYYRLATVDARLDEALRDAGRDGWELVSILPESRLFHGFQCVMKRPLANPDPTRYPPAPVSSRINKYLTTR